MESVCGSHRGEVAKKQHGDSGWEYRINMAVNPSSNFKNFKFLHPCTTTSSMCLCCQLISIDESESIKNRRRSWKKKKKNQSVVRLLASARLYR